MEWSLYFESYNHLKDNTMKEELISLGFREFEENVSGDYYYYSHNKQVMITHYSGVIFSKIPGHIKAFRYDFENVKQLISLLN